MFERLRRLFRRPEPPPPPSEALSTALLLVELARADFDLAEAERARILELLAGHFGLGAAQAQALLEEAHGRALQAISLYDYVAALNSRLGPADKGRLIELLWRVAYADGRIDKYEEHLLRKLAELLYVSQEDYIRAKLRAADGYVAVQQ
jgi:uncharacterized tellurite resistance protein B-like protein